MSRFMPIADGFDDLMDILSGARRYAGRTFAAMCITLGAGRARMQQSRFDHMVLLKGSLSISPMSAVEGYKTPLAPERGFRVVDGGGRSKHSGPFMPREVK